MRITIVPDDQFVSKDSVGYHGIDMTNLDPTIHAVQWFDTEGWIEYKEYWDSKEKKIVKPENKIIDNIDDFQTQLDEWDQADYNAHHPEVVPNTKELNVVIAKQKLIDSDWSQLPDVKISNVEEFSTYRQWLRDFISSPQEGNIDWPLEPEPVWIK